ncbi:MAG: glycerophosphodiester phosphodiesterase [Myxococcota bacterium]
MRWGPPRLLGHRGACAERPENTMASFERAVALGVDVIETDVHLTRDGHVVVAHDPNGQRAANRPEAIRDCSLEELRAWDVGWGFVAADGTRPYACQGMRMPLLREVLEAFPEVAFNVDIKQRRPSMVAPLLEVLRASASQERVTLASFHPAAMREVRARGFTGATALSRDEIVALVFLPRWPARLLVAGQAVQIPPRTGAIDLSTRGFIEKCHRMGLWVDYWTINDPLHAEVLLERGADGLISDDPARLQSVIARYR